MTTAKVGGPQIANPQIFGLNNLLYLRPSANVALCGLVICGPNLFGDMRICTLWIWDLRTQAFLRT
jgi:hypothetical protein